MKAPSALPADALLDTYDHGQLRYAVAYGSGAVRQDSYESDANAPMLDLIFAVDHPERWHAANMERHPRDYSGIRLLGPGAVAAVQEWGAGVYYNTYVRFGSREIKYGVIATHRLVDDLLRWDQLYVAGRLHKPVQPLRSDDLVDGAQQQNLDAAVAAARLLLPEVFTEKQLYGAVAGLSYSGDVRMGIGENPRKVENIVNGSLEGFRTLYAATLAESPELLREGDMFLQDDGTAVRGELIRRLPVTVRKAAQLHPEEDIPLQQARLRLALRAIVGGSSTVMTLKGLLTAGPIGAMRYLSEKVAKRMKR